MFHDPSHHWKLRTRRWIALLIPCLFALAARGVIGRDPKAHEFTLANCDKDIRYYNQLATPVVSFSALASWL